jgi:hypothetical protein
MHDIDSASLIFLGQVTKITEVREKVKLSLCLTN